MTINSTNISLRSGTNSLRREYGAPGSRGNNIHLSLYYRSIGNVSGLVNETRFNAEDPDYILRKPGVRLNPQKTGYEYYNKNYARSTDIWRWDVGGEHVVGTDIIRTWRWGGRELGQETSKGDTAATAPGTNPGFGPRLQSLANTDRDPEQGFDTALKGEFHYGTPGMYEPDGGVWPGFENRTEPSGSGPNSVIDQFFIGMDVKEKVDIGSILGGAPRFMTRRVLWYAMWEVRGRIEFTSNVNTTVPENLSPPPNEEISFSDFIDQSN